MPQIGWQLPGLLSKNKKMKEMSVIQKSAWYFTSRPSSWGIIKMSWPRLWIMGAVKPVGQLYGCPTALTSQYLAWDRYFTYVVQTPRVKRRIFLEQIRPFVAPEPREGCKHEVCGWIHILLCIETKQANIWRIEINSLFFQFPWQALLCKSKKIEPYLTGIKQNAGATK